MRSTISLILSEQDRLYDYEEVRKATELDEPVSIVIGNNIREYICKDEMSFEFEDIVKILGVRPDRSVQSLWTA